MIGIRISILFLTCTALFCAREASGFGTVPDSILHADSVTTVHFSIAKNYLGDPDSIIEVSQFITDSVPITSFSEMVKYDMNVVQLSGVQNGAVTPLPSWSIQKAVTTQGMVQIIATTTGLPLQKPGEVIQFYFHILSTAHPFDISFFTDSNVSVVPPDPVAWDTGELMVIDDCVPLLSSNARPSGISLHIPNPLSQSSELSYFLPASAPVRLSLFNSAGSLMRQSEMESRSAGWHNYDWNLTGLSGGIYTAVLQSGGQIATERLFLLQ